MTKKMTTRQARKALVYGSDNEKDAVKQELHVQKAIKKVKVTPNQYGNAIEVEMHDKLSALRVLAKHHGLMEPNADSDTRPSVIGINMTGPTATTYEVIEDGKTESGQEPEDQPEEKIEDDQKNLF